MLVLCSTLHNVVVENSIVATCFISIFPLGFFPALQPKTPNLLHHPGDTAQRVELTQYILEQPLIPIRDIYVLSPCSKKTTTTTYLLPSTIMRPHSRVLAPLGSACNAVGSATHKPTSRIRLLLIGQLKKDGPASCIRALHLPYCTPITHSKLLHTITLPPRTWPCTQHILHKTVSLYTPPHTITFTPHLIFHTNHKLSNLHTLAYLPVKKHHRNVHFALPRIQTHLTQKTIHSIQNPHHLFAK